MARRTREVVPTVPRLPLPMNWQHNQKCERRPRLFCGFPGPRISDLPRQWVSPFCSRADAGGRLFPFRGFFMPHAERVSSRARSAFHRAGHFFRAVAGWTREGTYFRSEAFSCRTQSVFHRGHGVPFIAPEVFIHSVARRTREDASAVPRLPLPMNWQHNQKREGRPRPFCGFSRSAIF